MRPPPSIGITSLLLTLVASFTDSATFIGADKLFSAHVTGNFIILAYDIIHHAGRNEWSKLLSFPVFFCAVMLAGKIDGKGGNPGKLLQLEGVFLILAGLGAIVLRMLHVPLVTPWSGSRGNELPTVLICMTIVAAMGFQNAFGRLYVKRIYGPTTVMTGNVTSAALDIIGIFSNSNDPEKLLKLQHNLALILVFLLGCLAGGFLSWRFGLAIVLLPGVLVLCYFRYIRPTNAAV